MLGVRQLRLMFAVSVSIGLVGGQNGSISGVVTDGPNGDPVLKAIVTLTWHGEPKSWATLRTGSDGLFKFEGLPAGNYDLTAEKQGLGTAIYGADHVGQLGDLVPLANGQSRDGLKLRFLRASMITGRVLDPDGDPAGMSSVSLYRMSRNLGEKTLVRDGFAIANDRGEYKLKELRPGHYYLSATPRPGQPSADALAIPASVYYGDTEDWHGATEVTVRDGENLTGIDFHLIAEPPVRLHGHVTGVPQSDPSPGREKIVRGGVQVLLNSIDRPDNWNLGIGASQQDNEFGNMNVPPGRYSVEATTHVDGKTYDARQVVDLRPGSPDIELALTPAIDLKGRLRIEGGTAQQASAIEINLARPRRRDLAHSAHAVADGRFTMEQIPSGEWVLNLNLPRELFLKSVMLGDKNVLFQKIEIEPGSDAALNIVVSMNSAIVKGEVDAAGGDAARAGILLAPIGKFHELARFYYAVSADDDGKFKMTGIAPGKYKIFALEKIAGADYRSPEAADALNELLEGGAQEIDVGESASIDLHPKLIPFERASQVIP
jgi:Carboxypeptidase regulatory-like domain